MTPPPPIPATPAATAKTLPDIAAKYRTVPTTLNMSFTLDKEIAENVSSAEMRELQKLIGMGYRAAREEIAGDVANAAHLAEQWRELRRAEHDAWTAFSEARSVGSLRETNERFHALHNARAALATFEQQNGIGGGD